MPAGVAERDLVRALADGWGLSAETLRYAPVGGGSYHWVVTSGPGEQWFVTVGDAHTVAVFPFLHGSGGEWDKPLTAPDLDELGAMLAALHRVDPAAVRLQRREVELSWPDDLQLALAELGRPWTGGPFAEPARHLLAGAAGPVRRGLDALYRW